MPKLTVPFSTRVDHFKHHRGFALPLAMGLGLVMLTLGATALLTAEGDRKTAWNRKQSDLSIVVAETGIARTLAQLSKPNNNVLLTRSYDTVSPKTNKTYLGPDGMFRNGDEENSAVNEWQNLPTTRNCPTATLTNPVAISYSGSAQPNSQYTLKSYRHNPSNQTSTLLVEGDARGSRSQIAVTLSMTPEPENFPGILASESVFLQGRSVTGRNGNVYYDPDQSSNSSMVGSAAPNESNRPQYLNAIWAGSTDGFNSDVIAGSIMACKIAFTAPYTPQKPTISRGKLAGTVNLPALGNGITSYEVSKVELKNNDTVTVDTTLGPVYLYVNGDFTMRGNSKILNIRTGKPPQVGDLRIINAAGDGYSFEMFDNTCIQTAFIYNPESDFHIQTLGDGCASPGSTNFEGVVWAEDVISSKTSQSTRKDLEDVKDDNDIIQTYGATSGIAVPEDVSSLKDMTDSIKIPIKYRLGQLTDWKRKLD
jgi:hypothetical protein